MKLRQKLHEGSRKGVEQLMEAVLLNSSAKSISVCKKAKKKGTNKAIGVADIKLSSVIVEVK